MNNGNSRYKRITRYRYSFEGTYIQFGFYKNFAT